MKVRISIESDHGQVMHEFVGNVWKTLSIQIPTRPQEVQQTGYVHRLLGFTFTPYYEDQERK